MTNLTYINDEQFISDAAKLILEKHLNSANSIRRLMEDSASEVEEVIISAYVDAHEADKYAHRDGYELFHEARSIARVKFGAVKDLLGF